MTPGQRQERRVDAVPSNFSSQNCNRNVHNKHNYCSMLLTRVTDVMQLASAQKSSPANAKGNSCLTNPVHSTICRWSTAVRMVRITMENSFIHSLSDSWPLLPSLRAEVTVQSKAVTNTSLLGSQEPCHEDWGWWWQRKELVPDPIVWTSLGSLFSTLDGNDKPVSQVSYTVTGLIWRSNYMWHHDELLVKGFILIALSEIIFY